MRDFAHTKTVRMLAACALWLVAWQVASIVVGSPILLAGPWETCLHLLALLASPNLPGIVWFSFWHVASGFLAAFALGVALALVAHRLLVVRELVAPLVLAFKSIPVACIVVLLLIWVGSRDVSGIAVFLVAFPALYLATLEGLDHVDAKVDEMLAVFGVRGVRRLLAHTWPSVLPYVVATSRNACGMAWKAGVAAELIGTPLGSMGERIYQAKILLETADLFAWTVLVVVVSYLCERAFVRALEATGPLALRLSLPRATTRTTPAEPKGISLHKVTIGHGTTAVSQVTLSLDAGARGLLSDASGTGKTTLIHTVAGLLAPLSGTVDVPQPISMVFQEARLIETLSPVENVLLVGAGALPREEIRALLGELLPAEALDRPVSELSGGQRRRVELVRALAHPSAVVLLDEPFASLDEESHRMAASFVAHHLEGRTLLMASHVPEDLELLGADLVSALGGD